MSDLAEIFSSLPDSQAGEDGSPVAPLRQVPELIATFERKRGLELLSTEERRALIEFANGMPEQPVGIDELLAILGSMGATSSPAPPSRVAEPIGDTVDEQGLSSSDSVASPTARNGSPAPRPTPSTARHRKSSTQSLLPRPVTPASRTPPSTSMNYSPTTRRNRRSGLFALISSPKKSAKIHDLSELVIREDGTYLGVKLDGPLGRDWDPISLAVKLRNATKGMGTREGEVIEVLGDKTYPQVRSIDQVYADKYGKTLAELVSSEVEFTLKGLIAGPLNFDVELLHKAFKSPSGYEMLLIELLIGRTPDDLVLLREAYLRSSSDRDSKHKTLESALAASFTGTQNAKMRKAWEIVLEGKWVDEDKTEEERDKLLKEDADQLKVALRPKGNVDLILKIIFTRSPKHIHSIIIEFRKMANSSLTHAIKQQIGGTLQKALLFAIENAKNDTNGVGVWRDAKMLFKSMEGVGTRNEALSWRVVRLHWDRSRFKLVQEAFQSKYRNTLTQTVYGDTSGLFRDILRLIILSANLPEPEETPQDRARLEAIRTRQRASSVSSIASVDATSQRPISVLEASGEMEKPPSPRSPLLGRLDDDATPQASSFPEMSSTPVDLEPDPFTLQSSTNSSPELGSSTSSLGHRSHSSLSARQRSSPLEPVGHRPSSSTGGSFSRSVEKGSSGIAQLRHNRPVAPRRMRRTSEDLSRPRANSEEATSPTMWDRPESVSPTDGNSYTPDRALSPVGDLAMSKASSDASTRNRRDSATSRSKIEPISVSRRSSTPIPSSPPASIDTTSYHVPPVSPVGDVGPPSTPPASSSASQYEYGDLISRFLGGDDSSPEKPSSLFLRRDKSTASNSSSSESSRPDSLFAGDAFGVGDVRPGSFGSTPEAQFQNLLRYANEMTKKFKDIETRFQNAALDYEQDHSELESRLDEARTELQVRRREEKELRTTEKQHLAHISALESDVSKLTKSLERSKEQYESMKRNYQDQCAEAEKLRNQLADMRRDVRAAEEAALAHAAQITHFEADREVLQAAITKLEEDLVIARRAQEALDDQKQENLVLKETIDRLRFDMDELRAAGRKSLFIDNASISSQGSGPTSFPGSVSKSLGRELARRLAQTDSQPDSSDAEEKEVEPIDQVEEVDDIIVTTHRRIKKRPTQAGGGTTGLPSVTHVEDTTVVADAETQTERVLTTTGEVQTELSAIGTTLILAPSVPTIVEPPAKSAQVEKKQLAESLGVDLEYLEELVKREKSSRQALSPPSSKTVLEAPLAGRRHGRWQRLSSRMNAATNAPAYFINVLPQAARPLAAQVLESSTAFVLYTLCVYLGGMVSGALVLPLTHHHHSSVPFHVLISASDRAYWHQFNNFNHAWGEGLNAYGSAHGGGIQSSFLHWVQELIWGGVSIVRRVPV